MDVYGQGLGLLFSSSPDIAWQYLELDPADGPFVKACEPFAVEVTATYRGLILAGADVYVYGFGFSPSGLSKTGLDGKIQGSIFFTDTQLGEYEQVGRVYWLSFGGVSQSFQGPMAVEFSACGGF